MSEALNVALSANEVTGLVHKAITAAVVERIGRGSGLYSISRQIDLAIEHGMNERRGHIASAFAAAIDKCVTSPEFEQAVRDALLKRISDKFAGAFDGVIVSAARKAAGDAATHARLGGLLFKPDLVVKA
jgi:hypothetical protein